jgi:hypothetical protein
LSLALKIQARSRLSDFVYKRSARADCDCLAERDRFELSVPLVEWGKRLISDPFPPEKLIEVCQGRRYRRRTYFDVLSRLAPEIGTRWRSKMDSNCRYRLFERKRPFLPVSGSSLTLDERA